MKNMKNKAEEKFAEEFAKLMIEKIETLDQDWQQPWFNTKCKGLPQSITGRRYNGMNSLMLYLLCERKGFNTPVFMTFNQARNMEVVINKGEKSFPVIFWDFTIRNNETRERITIQEYHNLTDPEKADYTVRPFLVYHNVFNADQTNIKEVRPEIYKQLEERFHITEPKDAEGLYTHPALDEMVEKQGWLCAIRVTETNNALYRRSTDEIFVPLKQQFKTGEQFYSTLLHEMTHSTGVEQRLGRKFGKSFGDEDYAREELVAELTSALVSQSLGITSSIQDENAAYLKGWLGNIRQSPDFLMDILSDVNKASRMVTAEVAKFDKSLTTAIQEEEQNMEETEKEETSRKQTERNLRRRAVHL